MTPQIEQATASRGMVVDVEVGEGLVVTVPTPDSPGRNVTVTLLYKSGRHARLRISTDDDVAIKRKPVAHATG